MSSRDSGTFRLRLASLRAIRFAIPCSGERLPRTARHRLYGEVKVRKSRNEFLAVCRYLRSLHPSEVRIAIVLDNFSSHLSTKKDACVGDWAAANNVELAYVPFYASWLNRIEAQFTRCAPSPSTAPTTRHMKPRAAWGDVPRDRNWFGSVRLWGR